MGATDTHQVRGKGLVMSFFEELKRRNVFRMGIAYVVGTWLLS